MSGPIGNRVTLQKVSAKKDKELEGTGEPLRVRRFDTEIERSWFSVNCRDQLWLVSQLVGSRSKRTIIVETVDNWFSS